MYFKIINIKSTLTDVLALVLTILYVLQYVNMRGTVTAGYTAEQSSCATKQEYNLSWNDFSLSYTMQ